eukprot:PhF_6_TR25608/c0_g1_i2/m.35937
MIKPLRHSPGKVNALSPSVLRCAFDVGSLNRLTFTLASVHTKEQLIRKHIHHAFVPWNCDPSDFFYTHQAGGGGKGDDVAITPTGEQAMRNAFHQVYGLITGLGHRPKELAGVVCGTLAKASNAEDILNNLSQEFFVKFGIASHEAMELYAYDAHLAAAGVSLVARGSSMVWVEIEDRVCILNRSQDGSVLQAWDTKYRAKDIHEMLLEHYQNRTDITSAHVSCNPVNVVEAKKIIHDLVEAFKADIPDWLRAHVDLDDGNTRKKKSSKSIPFHSKMFSGSSKNGGTLNLLARCCGMCDVNVNNVMAPMFQKYCGSTDSFLGRTFPEPALVVPRLILGISILKALNLSYIKYVADVAPTYGVLLDSRLFAAGRAEEVLSQSEMEYGMKEMYFQPPWKSRNRITPHMHP